MNIVTDLSIGREWTRAHYQSHRRERLAEKNGSDVEVGRNPILQRRSA